MYTHSCNARNPAHYSISQSVCAVETSNIPSVIDAPNLVIFCFNLKLITGSKWKLNLGNICVKSSALKLLPSYLSSPLLLFDDEVLYSLLISIFLLTYFCISNSDTNGSIFTSSFLDFCLSNFDLIWLDNDADSLPFIALLPGAILPMKDSCKDYQNRR